MNGRRRRLWVPITSLAFALAGCGTSPPPPPQTPEVPEDWQAKCAVAKSRSRPLIVEWPSTDRAALEAASRRGLVVVRYLGCEMELLPRCHVEGEYRYTPVTPQSDRINIHNLDDLYAHVPLGAAKLEGELSERGELHVDMTIVGSYDATRAHEVDASKLAGDCQGATHVVGAMSAGAFSFYAGAATSAGGGVGAFGVGAGGKHAKSRAVLSQSGSVEACRRASRDDTSPPEGCGALVRVEVVELAPAPSPPAAPVVPERDEAPDEAPDEPRDNPAVNPAPAPTSTPIAAPAIDSPATSSELPPWNPRRIRLDPGVMLGLRGPFDFSFGNMQDDVSWSDATPIAAGVHLEVGYRVYPEIAVVLLAGLKAGSSSSSSGLCPLGVKCTTSQARTSLGLHANDPSPYGGFWSDLSAVYTFSRLKREGEPVESSAGEYDTSIGYHAAGGALQIGWDWVDDYVPQIRYGFMIGYTLTRTFDSGGRNVIGGTDVPLGEDFGFSHSILFGGRLHGEIAATAE